MFFPLPSPINLDSRSRGFSLIELLVVASITAIVLALAFPAISQIRVHAKAVGCATNLRAIGHAVALYAADNNNYLPSGYIKIDDEPASTWFSRVGPYLPGASSAKPLEDLPNSRYCPSTSVRGDGIFVRDVATWRTDYAYNAAIFPGATSYPIKKRKLLEATPDTVMLYDGRQSGTANNPKAYARHRNRINVLFFGGHVELRETMPDEKFW